MKFVMLFIFCGLLSTPGHASDTIDLGQLEIQGDSRMPQLDYLNTDANLKTASVNIVVDEMYSIGVSEFSNDIRNINDASYKQFLLNKEKAQKAFSDLESSLLKVEE
jgi:hypothetical protein